MMQGRFRTRHAAWARRFLACLMTGSLLTGSGVVQAQEAVPVPEVVDIEETVQTTEVSIPEEIEVHEVQDASKTPLGTPSGLTWTGAGTARWNAVPNADAYRIKLRLYKQPDGQEAEPGVGYTQLMLEEEVTESASTTVDLQDAMTKMIAQSVGYAPAARFQFSVMAVASGTNASYRDGSYSSYSAMFEYNPAGLILLPRPKNLKLTGTSTLSWDRVDGAGRYTIQIEVSDKDGSFYTTWDETEELSFDFADSLRQQLFNCDALWENERWKQTLRIKLAVVAQPAYDDDIRIGGIYRNESLPETDYSIGTLTKLQAPAVSWTNEYEGDTRIVFDKVDGAYTYLITVYYSLDGGKSYERYEFSTSYYEPDAKIYYPVPDSLTWELGEKGIPSNTPLKVYATVKSAYGWSRNNPFNSEESAAVPPIDWVYIENKPGEMDAPKNPRWSKNSYVAEWDPVPDVDYYIISLFKKNSYDENETWNNLISSETVNISESYGGSSSNALRVDFTDTMRRHYLQEAVNSWNDTYCYEYRFQVVAVNGTGGFRFGKSDYSPTAYYYPNGKLDKLKLTSAINAVPVGHKKLLGFNVEPQTVAYGRATWKLNRNDIAYIDDMGRIEGWQTGKVTATVTIGELSDSVVVTIYDSNVEGTTSGNESTLTDKGNSIVDEALNNPGVAPQDTEDFDWDKFWKAMEDPEHGFDIGVEQKPVKKPKLDAEKWMRKNNSKWKGGVLNTFDIRIGMGPADARFCYLTRFDNAVGFEVPVPKDLAPVAKGKKRAFFLLRNHKGQITKIPVIMESNGTYRAYSDRYSEFTLVYEDTAAEADTATGRWKKSKKGWWFAYKNGGYPRNKWERIKGEWYHFDQEGYMQTGWQKIKKKWYYFEEDGEMETGWVKYRGKWYYLKPEGEMATGWQKVGLTWYYLNKSGVMQKGWVKVGTKWYYLKSSGAMATGWIKSGGKWYYLKASGVMASGETLTIEGKKYAFAKNGIMK